MPSSPEFALAIAFIAVGQQPVAILDAIPKCERIERASTAGWSETTYGGLTLQLPAGFVSAEAAVVFDHGGQRWAGGAVSVEAIRGVWGLDSFRASKDSQCVATAGELQVLLMEQKVADQFTVTAWAPGLRPGDLEMQPILAARSSRQQDLPILRAIVLSIQTR